MTLVRRALVAISLFSLLGAAEARAQKLTLAIPSGSRIEFPTATEADKGGTNAPWGNSLYFRVKLTWTGDAPATFTPTTVAIATLRTP